MRQKLKEDPRDIGFESDIDDGNDSESGCHHYWMIETANGPKSLGVCQFCGENKYFSNSISDYMQIKRNPISSSKSNPLTLPEMPEVEIDKGSES